MSNQPIFIGGTGRSGTTILARVLGRHPDVHTMRWETQLLTHPQGLVQMHARGYRWKDRWRFFRLLRGSFYRRVLRASTPDAYEAGLCADVEKKVLRAALWRFNRRLLVNRNDDGMQRTAAALLVNELFAPAMQRAGASTWCEKTPSNVLYFRELREMFPGARFLHIVRDPRDVVCSMLQRNFWPIAPSSRIAGSDGFRGDVTFEKAVAYWEGIIRAVEDGRIDMGDSLHTLRLEDLVADPEQVLVEILRHLDLSYDDGIIDAMIHPANDKTGLLVPVHERHANIDRWRTELDEAQLEYLEARLSALMQNHGYRPVAEKDATP